MVQSLLRRRSRNFSSLYLFTVFLILQLIYGSLNFHVEFEKGIEIIRSRGYLLSGDSRWPECVAGGDKVTEVSLNDFLKICERESAISEHLIVHSDYYEKIIFVYATSSSQNVRHLYYCRLR